MSSIIFVLATNVETFLEYDFKIASNILGFLLTPSIIEVSLSQIL